MGIIRNGTVRCRQWMRRHPGVRKGLVLGLLVLGVDLSAVACGGEEITISQEADTAMSADLPESSTQEEQDTASAKTADTAVQAAEETLIYVYVSGAVVHPGVYALSSGARIFEAVDAAGGLTQEAAAAYVNQAAVVYDGEQIYFPTREEADSGNFSSPVSDGSGTNSPMAKSSSPTAPVPGTEENQPDTADTADSDHNKVNINTADKAGLQSIPGVGEKKAEAILSYREAHGAFDTIEEIMQVEGIKNASFEKMRDYITVE